ncbi:MAG: citramalate synthase [Chloroflexi bacterium]|nr:citramalate synthase [Chloroflexota bacterium]
MAQIMLYDTTLRDGTQQEGISPTLQDKLDITVKLDALGVHVIEGGMPGAVPKDTDYFRRVWELPLRHARIAAFGSTRRANTPVAEDANIAALVESKAPICTLVGKSWDLHVIRVLETTLEENLRMLADSISYLKEKGREVYLDAEHFFDGFRENPEYALQCLKTAATAGADYLVLCDTNGGTLPSQIARVVDAVRAAVPTPVGIHAHNDGEMAVASSLAAIEHGATQVQGTINGYGERCGNANLCSIIPTLQVKMGIQVVSPEQLANLSETAKAVGELLNEEVGPSQPYIGRRAFTHKAGFHASGVAKVQRSYEHMDPTLVGNARRVLVSELAGRSNVLYVARQMGIEHLVQDSAQARKVLDSIKANEAQGFQYEEAEASFELVVRRAAGNYQPPFRLEDFMVVVERHRRAAVLQPSDDALLSEAMVKVWVDGELYHNAAEGNGPVNALDNALRKALREKYHEIDKVALVDYKVRILNESGGTGAVVRVRIESTDGEMVWRTVGSSTNIIWASWLALTDSLEYWLLKSIPALAATSGHPSS